MRRQFAAVAVLSTAAAVLSLAGCGGSSSTNPSSSDSFKNLPAAEQQTFETAAVDEITADISSFTSLSPLSGLFFEKVAPNRLNGALRMARVKAKAPRFQNTDCAAESGDLTDPDNDGVVNADTTTFNCNETSSGETITESGFFAFGDPTPNTTDLDISDAANLVLGITGGTDGNINLTLDGSATINQGTSSLTLQGDWNINEQLANNPQGYNGTFKLGANETATYSFTGTAPTTFGTLPEPGQFSLSGSWTYAINTTSENINLSFTVSTPTPLTIDGCAGNPQGVDSGEVDIKFADGTLVKAVWTSCPSTPSITVT
jgi:hypothetical protein